MCGTFQMTLETREAWWKRPCVWLGRELRQPALVVFAHAYGMQYRFNLGGHRGPWRTVGYRALMRRLA